MVFLRMTAARWVQSGLVGGGAASIAVGVGLMLGVGAGLVVAGIAAVAYGLLLVDDGTAPR